MTLDENAFSKDDCQKVTKDGHKHKAANFILIEKLQFTNRILTVILSFLEDQAVIYLLKVNNRNTGTRFLWLTLNM